MGFLDFLKIWFGTNEKHKRESKKKEESIKENKEDMKAKKSKVNDDKSFYPEILFLINRPYAEYVDFEEI
jgi:hypothetical protein